LSDVASGTPVDPVNWRLIDRKDPYFMTCEGSTPAIVAPWGLKHILLNPPFSGDGTISLVHAVVPIAGLTSDSSVPDTPDWFHPALVNYAHARALTRDADGPRLGRALRQFGYYDELLERLDEFGQNRHEGVRQSVYGERFRVPRG